MGKRGPKPGTGGRPKKALYDNIIEDNPGKRPLKVLSDDINQEDTTDYTPPNFLNTKGIEIFNQTVEWLKGTGCLGFINPQHIGEYAHCKSRWGNHPGAVQRHLWKGLRSRIIRRKQNAKVN